MNERIPGNIQIKKQLKTKSFYLKAMLANSLMRGNGRLKASRSLVNMMFHHYESAFRGKKPAVLTTIWTPSELLYALDVIPLCIETTASHLAGLKLSDDYVAIAADNFHSRETCSFLGCASGAIIDKLFPKPAAVIAASHLCDGGAKAVFLASQVYNCDYFLIEVPQDEGEEAVQYVAHQLETLAEKLAEILGIKMNKEKLAETIDLSNQARKYAIRVNELRQTAPSPMKGSESFAYVHLLGVGLGSREALKIYKNMSLELEKRSAKKYSPLKEEKYRVLWLHLKPFYPNRIIDYLEQEKNIAIAFDDFNYISWPELNPDEPYLSIARRLISNHLKKSIGPSIDLYMRMVKEYKIDGVILFAHWGCRWNYSRIKPLKEAFQNAGIPFLSLDSDCIASANYNEPQLMKQIDIYLDILGR